MKSGCCGMGGFSLLVDVFVFVSVALNGVVFHQEFDPLVEAGGAAAAGGDRFAGGDVGRIGGS